MFEQKLKEYNNFFDEAIKMA
jgi:hypothetical protein